MSFLSFPENDLLCFCSQELCCSGSWLFLLRSDAFHPSCHLRCFGDRPALPPVHMECLLAKAPLRGSACVHHSCCLLVLHSNGSEPLLQSARLKMGVWCVVLHCNVHCATGLEEGKYWLQIVVDILKSKLLKEMFILVKISLVLKLSLL